MSFFNRIASMLLTPLRAIMMLFSRIIPGLKKLPGISVPARFGFLVFFCLIIFLISSTLHVQFAKEAIDQLWLKSIWTILLTILLLFLIPFLVYLALDQLMRREVPPFPDIQKAWKAGIKAMKEAGIDLKSTPIFFVIGSEDESAATALHQCAKTDLSLKNIPPGNAPIQWFGNDSAIFVHLAGASCVSKLVRSPKSSPLSANADEAESPGSYTGTIVGGMPAAPKTVVAGDEGTGTGTITGDNSPTSIPVSTGGPQPGPVAAFRPTQTIGADQSPMMVGQENSTGHRLEINQSDLELQIKRLRYVCSLVKKNRQPICPLNGIVTLVPFSAVESSQDQLQVALQVDLETIEDVCQLKCPMTILVNEIEREPGFSELMRRIDREHVQNGRIGSRYGNADTDIWTPITGERITAMAGNACKNIEDNILGFFRRDDALTKRGNGQLFILLSKLRGGYSTDFTNMWIAALGRVRNLMVGCYFVAIGDSEDRQGFVSSVIQEKVVPSRGKLSWNQSALAENNRYLMFSSLFALLALASIVWLIWMIGSDQNWWAALNPKH